MEAFYVLTEAMYQSLWQGIVVYLASRAILLTFPTMTSAIRYNILYAAHCLMFCMFCYNLITIGQEFSAVSGSGYGAAPGAGPAPIRSFSIRSLILNHAPVIGGLYVAGLVVQSLYLVSGLWMLHKLKKGEVDVPDQWQQTLEALRQKLQISKTLRLVSGARVQVPFTAGFLKPVIYFPVTAFNNLTTEQAEAILLHELAHIKRNDYLFNLIQKGIEMAMFFNPVSWFLASEIREEREFCCDDLVVCNIQDSGMYAKALFLLEEQQRVNISISLSATGSKNSLLQRIKRITTMDTYKLTIKPGLYALVGALAIGLSLAWIVPEEQHESKPLSKLGKVSARAIEKGAATAHASFISNISARPASFVPPALADTIPSRDTAAIKRYFNSPEWKKQMEEVKRNSEEIKKHFESPEWKKQMQDMKANSEELKKQFESPEWKKQMQDMKIHSEELKKHFEASEWKKEMESIKQNSEEMRKYFESPEWKKEMEEVRRHSEAMGAEMRKKFNSPEWKKQQQMMAQHGEAMRKHFDSPEWKKQLAEIEKQSKAIEEKFNSPEWKKHIEAIEKNSRELEKKLNSDWKLKMEELEKNGTELEKKLDSPDRKKPADGMEKKLESDQSKKKDQDTSQNL